MMLDNHDEWLPELERRRLEKEFDNEEKVKRKAALRASAEAQASKLIQICQCFDLSWGEI